MSEFYKDWKYPFRDHLDPELKEQILRHGRGQNKEDHQPEKPDLKRIAGLIDEAIEMLVPEDRVSSKGTRPEPYVDGAIAALEEIKLLLP